MNNSLNYQLTQYDVFSGASANELNFISPGTAGNFLVSNGSSSYPSFKVPTLTSSVGTAASPTGTTSASYVNMGLGSSWNLTPATYGNILLTIECSLLASGPAEKIYLLVCYGTGSAPANGASATGTTIGINLITAVNANELTYGVPFSQSNIISGLTPGTAYWFDVQIETTSGVYTASINNVTFTAQEIIS